MDWAITLATMLFSCVRQFRHANPPPWIAYEDVGSFTIHTFAPSHVHQFLRSLRLLRNWRAGGDARPGAFRRGGPLEQTAWHFAADPRQGRAGTSRRRGSKETEATLYRARVQVQVSISGTSSRCMTGFSSRQRTHGTSPRMPL